MPDLWDDWVPGVLCRNQMERLCKEGFVVGADLEALDHSALDLHLSEEGYLLLEGAVKPHGPGFLQNLQRLGVITPLKPDSRGSWLLESKKTYLFRLKERVRKPTKEVFWGQATAKSSVGRVDVLARLIVDGMNHYEGFVPRSLLADGSDMFLEVTPITFCVLVRPGDSLNQLRLFYGSPEKCELRGIEIASTCLVPKLDGESKERQQIRDEHQLSVDLSEVDIGGSIGCCFRAAPPKEVAPIPLWKAGSKAPDPVDFWELIPPSEHGRLLIRKDMFDILRSQELLRVPAGIAVYARAIDEEIGEMRIHYAGFAHPYFGQFRLDDQRGAPLIFEVRGHNVDVSLQHGEILARLRFFRMSEDARLTEAEMKANEYKRKKAEAGATPTSGTIAYTDQNLNLSKYFREGWSRAPRVGRA